MAERYLVSSGDIEVAARWNGSTLPAVGDDLYANGFTGTISASRTALSWRTTAGTIAVAGGGFTCNVAGTAIGGNIIAGTTIPLALSNATGTITLTGNVTASTTNAVATVTKSGAGSLAHVGNSTGGSGGTNSIAIQVAAGIFSGTGTYTSGSSLNSWGLQLVAANTTNTIVGDAIGGSSTSAAGVLVGTTNITLAITGNCTGSTCFGLQVTGAGSIVTISGDVTGGAGVSAPGVIMSVAGTVTVGGNAIGGTSATITATCFGAYNTGSGTLTVNGYAIGAPSGGVAAGVFGSIGGTTRVGSVRSSTTGVSGIAGKVFLSNLTTGTLQGVNSALTVKTFYPTDFSGLLPAVGDVRSGTVYNLTNSTGTLVSGRPSLPFTQQVIG